LIIFETRSFNLIYAFGMPLQGRKYQSSNRYRYGFNGKENDPETVGTGSGTQDYGFRIYNPSIGKFLSVDPATTKYPFYSPYLFAGDNPIRYIDVLGLGPGDKFATVDEAAIDFGQTFNGASIGENKEYGVTIFKVVDDKGVISYSYTEPKIGKSSGIGGLRAMPKAPKGAEKVAEAHTHGAYDEEYDQTKNTGRDSEIKGTKDENSEFSQEDEKRARSEKNPSYLATPNGELKKFDPKKHSDYEYDSISKDLPSDKNSPNKLNNNNSDLSTKPSGKPEPVINQ
jgi:RHS repeat-associated protein